MSVLARIESHIVSQILSPEAKTQYARGDISKRELGPYVTALREISSSYIEHAPGTTLSHRIDSNISAAAYALYYTPINAAKLLHILPLISLKTTQIRVLDLGCGPGTAGLTLLAALDKPLQLTCVEHSLPMRALARQLLSSFSHSSQPAQISMQANLKDVLQSSYDLVIAANVFAELEHNTAQETLDNLTRIVAPGGFLVLLEPGQLHHTRRLMQLRDRVLINSPQLTPVFPCLHRDPCPMLTTSQTDWCHGTIEWQQPPLNAQLDALLGFNKHRIKFSCFVFQEGAVVPEGVRILTPPLKNRLGVQALVCGKNLYGIARVPKRLRSEHTKAFEKANVYDRLICSRPFVGDAPEAVVISRAADFK